MSNAMKVRPTRPLTTKPGPSDWEPFGKGTYRHRHTNEIRGAKDVPSTVRTYEPCEVIGFAEEDMLCPGRYFVEWFLVDTREGLNCFLVGEDGHAPWAKEDLEEVDS